MNHLTGRMAPWLAIENNFVTIFGLVTLREDTRKITLKYAISKLVPRFVVYHVFSFNNLLFRIKALFKFSDLIKVFGEIW